MLHAELTDHFSMSCISAYLSTNLNSEDFVNALLLTLQVLKKSFSKLVFTNTSNRSEWYLDKPFQCLYNWLSAIFLVYTSLWNYYDIPLESLQLDCNFWYDNLKHQKNNVNISITEPCFLGPFFRPVLPWLIFLYSYHVLGNLRSCGISSNQNFLT